MFDSSFRFDSHVCNSAGSMGDGLLGVYRSHTCERGLHAAVQRLKETSGLGT